MDMCPKSHILLICKNCSKLIYLDEKNMTLTAFLKSCLILKVENLKFFKHNFSYCKQLNKKNDKTFFLRIHYLLLAIKGNCGKYFPH